MPKVTKICSTCKKEVERAEKPKPKNAKESKQVDFICPGCGSANLRDGTARYIKKNPGPQKVQRTVESAANAEPALKEKDRQGNTAPGPGLIKEPEKKEIPHGENEDQRDDSWLII